MKKVIAFVLCLSVCLAYLSFSARAEESGLQIGGKAAIIMEVETGRILYEKNADIKLAPASITKVMTMILVMEAIQQGALQYDDVISASAHASSMGGSQIWLEPGEEMTVDELIRATMISSANDAAVALAEAVSGSEEAFVWKMNEKAASLGMTNTHFENVAGLDADNHLTTAKDIATMCRTLLQFEEIVPYATTWMDELRGGQTELVNTNKLVHDYAGITGLKTGTTSKAGRCLAASAKRDGMHIVAVILGCDTNDERYGDARKMLDWGFANFEAVTPKDAVLGMDELDVLGGVEERVGLYADITEPLVLEKGTADKLQYRVTLAKDVMAPVEEGQRVGQVEIFLEEKSVGFYPILCKEKVERMTFGAAFLLFLANILKIS